MYSAYSFYSTPLTAQNALSKNRVASEYSLHPIYKKEFHEVFTENQNDPEFKQLLIRMGVVDPQGESAMDEDQWDAASTFLPSLSRWLYFIFIFRHPRYLYCICFPEAIIVLVTFVSFLLLYICSFLFYVCRPDCVISHFLCP